MGANMSQNSGSLTAAGGKIHNCFPGELILMRQDVVVKKTLEWKLTGFSHTRLVDRVVLLGIMNYKL